MQGLTMMRLVQRPLPTAHISATQPACCFRTGVPPPVQLYAGKCQDSPVEGHPLYEQLDGGNL
jgi:hypothetical protein